MTINELIKDIHQNAKEHGWWDEIRSLGELLVLIHSEVSEALEEVRNGVEPTKTYYSGTWKNHQNTTSASTKTEKLEVDIEVKYKSAIPIEIENLSIKKPEGIPSELADIVIRVMDICGYYGIDLEAAIQEKIIYNKSRPYKHGGKKL